MTLAPDSITITDAPTGQEHAGKNVGGKFYPVVMLGDDSGHLQQTVPTYTWSVPGGAVGANKLFADIFNPAASGKILEIRGLWAIPKGDVTNASALATEIGLYRTSAAGTGGTPYTYNGGTVASTAHVITPWDTANTTTLTTSIVTARMAPTGGATIAAVYWPQYVYLQEDNAACYVAAFTNLLPVGTVNQRITLNEGQGLLIKQGAIVNAGSIGFLGLITVV